jgi:glycosyltransferase involved in cell wall biosynthesis
MNGVSVIICCYNAAARINKTLEHLQKQIVADEISWEVIVVDNASTDNTSSIAQIKWNEHPVTELKVVAESKPGLMNARRKGLQTAQYDIVSFIDDDNWVETDWVQKVADVFAMNEKIGACGGRSEAIFEEHKPEWFDDYQSSFAVGVQGDQSGIVDDKKGFLWGAGLSFRKSLWHELENRGFKNLTVGREGKNITAGEDSELCYAIRLLGYHLYYNKDLGLKHFMPANRMNIKYLGKMFEGFGKAYARLNSYRVLLEKDRFKLYPWWREWIAAKRKNIFFSILQIFVLNRNKKIKIITDNAYLKGYAEVVWIDKNTVQENIQTLKKIFK